MKDDETFSRATLGVEAEKFLSSRLGRYLIGRAESEIDAARLQLDDHDPADVQGIRSLQGRIAVAKNFGIWLQEAVVDGLMAEQQIREEEGT